MVLLFVLAGWITNQLVDTDTPWLRGVLTVVIAAALFGTATVIMIVPGILLDEPSRTEGISARLVTLALLWCLIYTAPTGIISIIRGELIGVTMLPSLLLLALGATAAQTLFRQVSYNPIADSKLSQNAVQLLLSGHLWAGALFVVLVFLVVIGMAELEVALGVFLVWTVITQVFAAGRARKRADHKENMGTTQ
jgi:hypothetical protein